MVAFNTREGWSRNVSYELAVELRRRADIEGRELTGSLPSSWSSTPALADGCRCGWPDLPQHNEQGSHQHEASHNHRPTEYRDAMPPCPAQLRPSEMIWIKTGTPHAEFVEDSPHVSSR